MTPRRDVAGSRGNAGSINEVDLSTPSKRFQQRIILILQLSSPRIFQENWLLKTAGSLANAPACATNAYTRLKSVLQSVPWLLLILNGGPFDRMNIVVCLIKKYRPARELEEETGGNDLLLPVCGLCEF